MTKYLYHVQRRGRTLHVCRATVLKETARQFHLDGSEDSHYHTTAVKRESGRATDGSIATAGSSNNVTVFYASAEAAIAAKRAALVDQIAALQADLAALDRLARDAADAKIER